MKRYLPNPSNKWGPSDRWVEKLISNAKRGGKPFVTEGCHPKEYLISIGRLRKIGEICPMHRDLRAIIDDDSRSDDELIDVIKVGR